MSEIEDVRGQVVRAIDDEVRLGTLPVSELIQAADAVMTIIARLLAARDVATVEDLRMWQENHQEQAERRNRAENRAERAEAELRKWHEKCDDVGVPHDPDGLIRHHRGNAVLTAQFDHLALLEGIAQAIEKHAEEYGDPADNAYEYARIVRQFNAS
jgi:hypothetical protein